MTAISIPFDELTADSRIKLKIARFLIRSVLKSEGSLHQMDSGSITIEEVVVLDNIRGRIRE